MAASPPGHVGCAAVPDGAGGCVYESTGLPALTTDGTLVVYAEEDDLGEMGPPNFRVVERRVADDTTAEELMVEPPARDRLPAAERDANLDKANAALALLPTAPLTAYPRDCDHVAGNQYACYDTAGKSPITTQIGPLVVEFKEPRLRILRDGNVLLEKDMPSWSTPRQGGDDWSCTMPAYLGSVWADLDRGVLLLTVDYAGMASCSAPSTYHVLRLPG